MIRPLRQRHRLMVCVLGILLPVVFAVGIAARRPVPPGIAVPPALAARTNDFGQVVWTKTDLWPDRRVLTRVCRDAAGSGAVELIARDLVKPDVLVYWAAGKDTSVEGLPPDAQLLGALAVHAPLALPTGAGGQPGRLVLYSLADHEVVAASKTFIAQPD